MHATRLVYLDLTNPTSLVGLTQPVSPDLDDGQLGGTTQPIFWF